MPRKLPFTPRSIIQHYCRMLFNRSRERQQALKRDLYTCQCCGKKQSKAKGKEVSVQVHHLSESIDWEPIEQVIRRYLLVPADEMVTMCKECHTKNHRK